MRSVEPLAEVVEEEPHLGAELHAAHGHQVRVVVGHRDAALLQLQRDAGDHPTVCGELRQPIRKHAVEDPGRHPPCVLVVLRTEDEADERAKCSGLAELVVGVNRDLHHATGNERLDLIGDVVEVDLKQRPLLLVGEVPGGIVRDGVPLQMGGSRRRLTGEASEVHQAARHVDPEEPAQTQLPGQGCGDLIRTPVLLTNVGVLKRSEGVERLTGVLTQ